MQDAQPLLEAAVRRCHASGAFCPHEAGTGRPPALLDDVKEKTTFQFESPLRRLAMEMLGLDAFKARFRHLFKKPYAPLRPYVEAHFGLLTHAYSAVLGEDEALASLWYQNTLSLPFCGLGDEELTGAFSLFTVLPTLPWHQGLLTPRRGLRSAFEVKIRRTDIFGLSALRGLPQSPWDQEELLASYLVGLHYPALWAGMRAWQHSTALLAAALRDTAGQMQGEFTSDWLGIYAEHLDMIAHVMIKAHFPLFMLPGMALHLLDQPELPEKLSADDIVRGLMQSMARGAFSSTARTDDAMSVKFTCPFNGAGIRLLMLDTGGQKSNAHRAMPAFVLSMQENGEHQSYVQEVRRQLKKLLRRCPQKCLDGFLEKLQQQARVRFRAALDG